MNGASVIEEVAILGEEVGVVLERLREYAKGTMMDVLVVVYPQERVQRRAARLRVMISVEAVHAAAVELMGEKAAPVRHAILNYLNDRDKESGRSTKQYQGGRVVYPRAFWLRHLPKVRGMNGWVVEVIKRAEQIMRERV
jgi:hypothetical protein